MGFQLRLIQTGQNLPLQQKQYAAFMHGLARSCGTIFRANRLMRFVGRNVVQFPAMLKDVGEGRWDREFWLKFAEKCTSIVDFAISAYELKPGDEIWYYYDLEPGAGDFNDDGTLDHLLKTDFIPDDDLVGVLGLAYSLIDAACVRRGLIPRRAGWSYGKAPNGNVSDAQKDAVRFLHRTFKLDWLSMNGYPYILPDSPAWSRSYLGESYEIGIGHWRSAIPKVPIGVSFQCRARHVEALSGDEVYSASFTAAKLADSFDVWMQAEVQDGDPDFGKPGKTVDHYEYWERLAKPCYEPMASGLLDGLASRA